MLNIRKFVVNPLQENCYIVSDETQECIIIDCGAYTGEERRAIVEYVGLNNLQPKHSLLTHAHIDHYIGNDTVFNAFGIQPEVHLSDEPLTRHLDKMCEYVFNEPLKPEMPAVGRYFTGKDIICFGSHELSVIETPGHSPGSVFFYCEQEKTAFSGDTLFKGSIGRIDLEGGSMFQIIQSLRTICQLDDDVTVYPGHGETTNIGYECATNPYIDR